MNTHGVGKTDVGRVRDSNEDAFFVDDDLGLYIVSDGMGGAAGGEVASRLAIETIVASVSKARPEIAKLGEDPAQAERVVEILRAALLLANTSIHDRAVQKPELRGMGCTVTAAVVAGQRAVIAHVGDSRAYVRENGKIQQVTSDHTLAEEMMRASAMSPEDAETHAFAHILTRAIGTQPAVKVDAFALDLDDADALLLCSDGLTDHAHDARWLVERMADLELDEVPDALIAQANESGGEDNITVVVVGVRPEHQMVRRGLLGRIGRWLDR